MRKLVLALALLVAATSPAWACYVETYIINGRVITCHVCPGHTVCNG